MASELQILSWILWLGAAQGFFLSLLLLSYPKGNKIANRILAFHLILFSLSISIPELIIHFPLRFAPLIGSTFPLMFLFGPSIYFYTALLTQQRVRFVLKDAWHLGPSLLSFLLLIPFYLQSTGKKLNILSTFESNGPPIGLSITWGLECFHVIVYLLLTIVTLKNYQGEVRSSFSSLEKINLKWLKNLILGNIAVWTIYSMIFLVMVFNFSPNLYFISYYAFGMAVSILVYSIGYFGLRQPEIFASATFNILSSDKQKKYQKTSLNTEQSLDYRDKLKYYMEIEKPYKNPSLNLSQLSHSLNIPSHHLSQVINDRIGLNFFDFVNSYRIKEATQLLSDPQKSEYTIIELAYKSGFNSKSTFNAAFKRFTCSTPTEFRKNKVVAPL